MAGKTVYVVTGGNRGVGLGFVQALVQRPNTTVIATVRNAKAAESLAAETITPAEGSAYHVAQLDFTNAPSPDEVHAAITKAAGGSLDHIDVLINNAGMCPTMSKASETSAVHLRAAYETNAIAPLMVFQALWPLLQKATKPVLIMVTSSVGSIGVQEASPGGAYGPSKAALNWLTRALHLQNPELIAIAMHPGFLQTANGNFVAKEWGYAPGPPDKVDKNVQDMLKIIDGATREAVGGKYLMQNGYELPW